MEFTVTSFIILGASCFLATFIDAIAGGGGMISLPAYMAIGLPPHIALGTNKFSACFGAISSCFKFWKAGKTTPPLWIKMIPFSIIGAIAGVKTVLLIDQKYLYPFAFCTLIILIIYSLFNKQLGNVNEYPGEFTKRKLYEGIIFALILGFYDGFFGPGTGSFLIFGFIKLFKFDFIYASGNTKVLNLASNITSGLIYIIAGKVNYYYGLPMAVFMILGGYAGSKLAILRGSKFIKPFFLLVSSAVLIKMAYGFIDFKGLIEKFFG